MIKLRREGELIPTGLSLAWAYGPYVNWMNRARDRRWRVRLRLFHREPMFEIEHLARTPENARQELFYKRWPAK